MLSERSTGSQQAKKSTKQKLEFISVYCSGLINHSSLLCSIVLPKQLGAWRHMVRHCQASVMAQASLSEQQPTSFLNADAKRAKVEQTASGPTPMAGMGQPAAGSWGAVGVHHTHWHTLAAAESLCLSIITPDAVDDATQQKDTADQQAAPPAAGQSLRPLMSQYYRESKLVEASCPACALMWQTSFEHQSACVQQYSRQQTAGFPWGSLLPRSQSNQTHLCAMCCCRPPVPSAANV